MAKDFHFRQGQQDRARQNQHESRGHQEKVLWKPWNAFTTPKHYRPPKDSHGKADYLAGWKKQGWK